MVGLVRRPGALKPGAPSKGGWRADQLSTSGTMVRNQLRKAAGIAVR